jgi:hypothetical protein
MFEDIDIDDILAEVAKFRDHVSKVHSRLKHPQERQLLGEVLAKIDESRFEAKEKFTAAVAAMEQGVEQAKSTANANLAKTAQLRQQLDEMLKAQAAAAQAQPPQAQPPEFDFQLGERLSREMLAQFEGKPAASPADRIADREIWQDWSWSSTETT